MTLRDRSNRSAEQITPRLAYHGEGPFWDTQLQRLLVLDVFDATVVSVDANGGVSRHKTPGPITSLIRRRSSGGFILATGQALTAATDDLASFEHFVDVIDDPTARTNDGGCDPLGGLVIGTMSSHQQLQRGAVYRVSPSNRNVLRLVAPVSISNGIQWARDGTRVFYVDSPTRRVDIFDVDPASGAWANRRLHIDLRHINGVPDGMAIDEADGLWIAMWGGGSVIHYDHSGRHVETVTVPGASQVSSCTFGGDDLCSLFITTSREGMRSDQEPLAGSVFSVRATTRGGIPNEFTG
jgi:sugar lactone lactonase YvrE